MRQVGATIWVRFLNKTCLSRTYAFYLDKECNLCKSNDSFRNVFTSYAEDGTEVFAKFIITNENGYNYRGGEVVVTDYEYGDVFEFNPVTNRNITFLNEIKYVGDTKFIAFGNNTKNKNLPIDYKDLKKMKLNEFTSTMCELSAATESAVNSFNTMATAADTLKSTVVNSETLENYCNCADIAISGMDSNSNSISWAGTPLQSYNISDTVSISNDYSYFNNKVNDLEERIKNMETKNTTENSLITNLMKDVKFGKAQKVRMSMYGPAFLGSENECLAWDKKEERWVDVTGVTFNEGFAYMMPVAKDDVAVGDFILHNKMWVRVVDITEDLNLVIDKPFEKEQAIMMPTTNIFGFDFYTKLIYFGIDTLTSTADKKNPFGNLLPFLLLKDGKSDDMLPLMFMMNGTKGFDFKNPMLMYFLMKDSKNSDLLPLMMCMNNK